MKGQEFGILRVRRRRAWLALALLPLLTSCLGAVALPLIAGGTLMARQKHRVRAATQVHQAARAPAKPKRGKGAKQAASSSPMVVLTDLKELPPPSGSAAADDPWQPFLAYTLSQAQPAGSDGGPRQAALLVANPPLDAASRRDCRAPVPAVIIDLDNGPIPFDPSHLSAASSGLVEGLARLRQAGTVVLWISQLPASQAAAVAQALRSSGLDPQGQDQLLLIRNARDRKQLLREDANEDVCVVAIAGDRRADFDELFDYLRNPDAAVGLDKMMGAGWFLTPPLSVAAAASTER